MTGKNHFIENTIGIKFKTTLLKTRFVLNWQGVPRVGWNSSGSARSQLMFCCIPARLRVQFEFAIASCVHVVLCWGWSDSV